MSSPAVSQLKVSARARPLNLSLVIAAFGFTIFCSAFLLFQVQLIVAKYILPWFGGTPAVFTACMLFFQTILLFGYCYSHWVDRKLTARQQAILHSALILIAIAWLIRSTYFWGSPLLPGPAWKLTSSTHPFGRVVLVLLASVGIPYFLLSTTGPLLQSWYTRFSEGVPYRLYALSNAGSLLGLLSYPFIVEPLLRLRVQANVWAVGFLLFAGGCLGATVIANRYGTENSGNKRTQAKSGATLSWSRKLLWLLLAGIASVSLLATTNQICQDVAVVPFLWVLPLSLYLLSFVICFSSDRAYSRGLWSFAFGLAAALVCFALRPGQLGLVWLIAVYSFALFAVCMVCHGELVRLKPPEENLTSFYLYVAAGGVLGGVFVAIIAPLVFKGFWEFPLSLWLAGTAFCLVLLRDQSSWIYIPRPLLLMFAVVILFSGIVLPEVARRPVQLAVSLLVLVAVAALFLSSNPPPSTVEKKRRTALFSICVSGVVFGVLLGMPFFVAIRGASLTARNFYGVFRVVPSSEAERATLKLWHGVTLHGLQFTDESMRRQPTTYYSADSGIGQVLSKFPGRQQGKTLRIGVIGLGVGTLAAYGRKGDTIRFYEINPEVIRVAATGPNPAFSFVADSRAQVQVTSGDGRISLEQELNRGEAQNFDVLVLDAFSGDAIPVHLLTKEALQLYVQHLNKSDGLLAFHISNRMLDLRPVIARLAAESRMTAWLAYSEPRTPGATKSMWVIVSPGATATVPGSEGMQLLAADPNFPVWTDDYSNLVRVIAWR